MDVDGVHCGIRGPEISQTLLNGENHWLDPQHKASPFYFVRLLNIHRRGWTQANREGQLMYSEEVIAGSLPSQNPMQDGAKRSWSGQGGSLCQKRAVTWKEQRNTLAYLQSTFLSTAKASYGSEHWVDWLRMIREDKQ